jgi:hypothetical protein
MIAPSESRSCHKAESTRNCVVVKTSDTNGRTATETTILHDQYSYGIREVSLTAMSRSMQEVPKLASLLMWLCNVYYTVRIYFSLAD